MRYQYIAAVIVISTQLELSVKTAVLISLPAAKSRTGKTSTTLPDWNIIQLPLKKGG
jgi:hypothetical protein